jgi:hypothetical protein
MRYSEIADPETVARLVSSMLPCIGKVICCGPAAMRRICTEKPTIFFMDLQLIGLMQGERREEPR